MNYLTWHFVCYNIHLQKWQLLKKVWGKALYSFDILDIDNHQIKSIVTLISGVCSFGFLSILIHLFFTEGRKGTGGAPSYPFQLSYWPVKSTGTNGQWGESQQAILSFVKSHNGTCFAKYITRESPINLLCARQLLHLLSVPLSNQKLQNQSKE